MSFLQYQTNHEAPHQTIVLEQILIKFDIQNLNQQKQVQMASFEDMASDLTATVHEIKSKKEKLKVEIQEDEQECQKIEEELSVLIDRKREIEQSLRQHKGEREELIGVIQQTEETKQKIIDSLKYLSANLKKLKIGDRH